MMPAEGHVNPQTTYTFSSLNVLDVGAMINSIVLDGLSMLKACKWRACLSPRIGLGLGPGAMLDAPLFGAMPEFHHRALQMELRPNRQTHCEICDRGKIVNSPLHDANDHGLASRPAVGEEWRWRGKPT